jgi:DNA-binding IclR family transcriptional regulator
MPPAQVDRVLARGMPPRTPNTITDPVRFKAQLWEVAQRGYALDDEENLEGVRCAAAPVFNLEGRLAGGISLSAPAMRVDPVRLQDLAGMVLDAARELSHLLGYQER